MRCEGQVAVVVGGGQGIGKDISLRLAAEGADIVIADISDENEATAQEVRKLGRKALVIYTDISSEESVKSMAKETLDTFGRVHSLINNAGIVGAMGQIDEISLEQWNESVNINLTGMFLTTRYLLEGLKKQGGSIVNIASNSAQRPMKCRSPYCTTKAAVVGFTKCLAVDLGEFGIRVNAISPGRVEGPRIEKTMQHAASVSGVTFDEYVHGLKMQAPLRSFVPPSAVADATVFLCSQESAYTTGINMFVNAGVYM